MPRVQLRNHKVHYQQTGHGPDVVLVHGLSCNIAFWWFHVAEHLAHSRRVTAIDLRGHGFSGMTDTGYRAVDLAADVAALLDHLDVAGAHVVGHSFGGAVAAALAAERPDLVAELTLADAWLPSLQPVPPLQGSAEWAATRARAEARGIQIDAALPLVVRGLFSELLDEIDFLTGDHDDHAVHRGPGHWEVGALGTGTGAGGGWRGSRLGRFWPAGGTAGLPGGWGAAAPRFLRRGATLPQAPQAPAAPPPTAPPPTAPPPAGPRIDRMTPEAREARRQALQGALLMTGTPGQPSQAVRRWHDLMHRTHARIEFQDVTGIEAPALRDIRGHVRLIYGARSSYRPTADALQGLLPRARLRLVPRAAHYFPLLRPQALLKALEEGFDTPAVREADAPRLRLIAQRTEAPLPDRPPARPEDPAPLRAPQTGAPRA